MLEKQAGPIYGQTEDHGKTSGEMKMTSEEINSAKIFTMDIYLSELCENKTLLFNHQISNTLLQQLSVCHLQSPWGEILTTKEKVLTGRAFHRVTITVTITPC